MSLYKRKDSQYYWVKICTPGYRTVQTSSRTRDKVKAKEFHDRLAAELWKQSQLKERPTYYWEQAALRFLDETQHKRDHQGDIDRLRWFHPFLEGMPLDQIDRDTIETIMKHKEHRAAGTINRYLATIRSILRKAEREWNWIDKAPILRMRKEPKKRVRWITVAEAELLLSKLPIHLSEMATFSLATGLRQRNVLELKWSQIDLARCTAWVHADEMKGKRDLSIPLNESAIAVLERAKNIHPEFVFTFRSKPLNGIDSGTWKKACKAADIQNFRWHDLRHTWASWHVQNGTDLYTLMELGGWSTYTMVLRYAHLASDHLQAAANRVQIEQPKEVKSSAATIQLRSNILAFRKNLNSGS